MPSLMNGALVGMMFSILDVCWMMLTFFGMRRRRQEQVQLQLQRRQQHQHQQQQQGLGPIRQSGGNGIGGIGSTLCDMLSFFKGINDTTQGGNAALGLVLCSHLLASLVLAPNGTMEDGCKISLPCLGGVVVLVVLLFLRGVKGHFLPVDQRERIQELRLGGGNGMTTTGGGGSYHND